MSCWEADNTAKQAAGMPVYMFANVGGCQSTSAGLIIDHLFWYSDNMYVYLLGAGWTQLIIFKLLSWM